MSTSPPKVTVGIPTYNRPDWLHECIASVLSQSYRDFRVLISDNASGRSTAEVVASFDDSRIDYSRSPRNLGMIGNINRIIERADTELLVIIPDDDILYSEYLATTVHLFDAHKSVGVVHTGHKRIDAQSRVFESVPLPLPESTVVIEPGKQYLDRNVYSRWGTVCSTSALLRTEAAASVGGMRATELPFADVPFYLRIALEWDFVAVAEPLVGVRIHEGSETSAAISHDELEDDNEAVSRILFDRRMDFLNEIQERDLEVGRYRRLAARAFYRDSIRAIAIRAGSGRPWLSTATALCRFVRAHPRALAMPRTWKLVAAQLGGRNARLLVERVGSGTR
jgi:glycosyltransferase involved in cell wall biosynthesis